MAVIGNTPPPGDKPKNVNGLMVEKAPITIQQLHDGKKHYSKIDKTFLVRNSHFEVSFQ